MGVNPADPTTLVWAVDQTYRGPEGEEVVSWSGPADSEFPASRTEVEAPASEQGEAEANGRVPGGGALPTIALLVALTALAGAIKALRSV